MRRLRQAVSRRPARLALFLAAGACGGDPAPPCAVTPYDLRPLVAGDSARLRVGTLAVSDCDPRRPRAARWRALDSAVATVTPEGLVRGVRTGTFRAVGVAGADTLRAAGFVLSAGRRVRIVPAAATVRVGDTVEFRVEALDSAGRVLPAVPFALVTAELQALSRAVLAGDTAVPLPDPPVRQLPRGGDLGAADTAAVVDRAERAGVTTVSGGLGGAWAGARLNIPPPAPAAPAYR